MQIQISWLLHNEQHDENFVYGNLNYLRQLTYYYALFFDDANMICTNSKPSSVVRLLNLWPGAGKSDHSNAPDVSDANRENLDKAAFTLYPAKLFYLGIREHFTV